MYHKCEFCNKWGWGLEELVEYHGFFVFTYYHQKCYEAVLEAPDEYNTEQLETAIAITKRKDFEKRKAIQVRREFNDVHNRRD